MKADLGLTATGEGLVTSTLLVGAAIGALVCGKLNDTLGRKKTLIILAVLFFVGTLGGVFAPSLEVMIPSRVILGLRGRRRLGHRAGVPGRAGPHRAPGQPRRSRRAGDRRRPDAGLHHERHHRQRLGRPRGRVALHARGRRPPRGRPVRRDDVHAGVAALAHLEGPPRRGSRRPHAGPVRGAGPGRDGGGRVPGRGGGRGPHGGLERPQGPVDPAPVHRRYRGGHLPAVHRHQLDHVLRDPGADPGRLLGQRGADRERRQRRPGRPRFGHLPVLPDGPGAAPHS